MNIVELVIIKFKWIKMTQFGINNKNYFGDCLGIVSKFRL